MCCPCYMTSLCSRIFYSVLQVSWSVLWLRHQFVTDVTAWLIDPNPSCSKNRKEKKNKNKNKIKWKEKIKTKSTIDDLDTIDLWSKIRLKLLFHDSGSKVWLLLYESCMLNMFSNGSKLVLLLFLFLSLLCGLNTLFRVGFSLYTC